MAIEINAKFNAATVLPNLTKMLDVLKDCNKQVAILNTQLAKTGAALESAASSWKSMGSTKLPVVSTSSAARGSTGGRVGGSSIVNPVLGMRTYAPAAARGHIYAASQFNRYRLAQD